MALATVHSAQEWLARFDPSRKASVVTIGNFDGVHLGHQRILAGVVERARATDLMAAVLTFFPHPSRILRPEAAPALLSTLPQRLAAFEAAGMDAALVLKFDAELAKVSAEDFARVYLVETLNARAVMIGGNFRFGHRQAGDVILLEELGRQQNFEVHVVPPVVTDGVVVSSSAIRQTLGEGRVEDAARLLGRPFALEGEIRPGTGQGRKLIVPTLNLTTEQECLPKSGVYATQTVVEGKKYYSATNIGVRPTFDGKRLTIESHLFDFSRDLTSGPMKVCFHTRLRDEQKFSGPQALKDQVLRDIEQAKEYFRMMGTTKKL
ncbi:MAG: bifunctional riboflavin kinase/FAD synthetase [Candidatus Acidiferrales bacterium]